MDFRLEPIERADCEAIVEIFNYYIEHSFAAYPDKPVNSHFFDALMRLTDGYPTYAAKDLDGLVIGFGLLKAYNPTSTFSHTAEITYFIKPEYTGYGIGNRMLHEMIKEAITKGISTILASISSRNEGSLRFHKKHGFAECGRFKHVGYKKGEYFDIIWMQKMI